MKNKFLYVLAVLSVLTIGGCKEKEPAMESLSAPQQVIVQSNGEQSLIIFDEVDNASYYDIYINDVCVTVKATGTGTIRFDASKIIKLPQKYTVKVKAVSDTHFDSAFTEDYVYNYTKVLDAPVITMDGTTINWNKVPNAQFYDVLVTSLNPTIETRHRFPTNSFNFSNILVNKGEYLFKVRAISENEEYESSIYSNQVSYVHTLKLETPYNLTSYYDGNELLLSFVSGENVKDFTINIDGNNYNFGTNEMSKYLCSSDLAEYDLENVYTIKLKSFAQSKGLVIDNSTLINVKIKANSTNQYLTSSDFSNTISCQFVNVLSKPSVTTRVNGDSCFIQINFNNSKYLSGFAIYLNDKKFKTLTKDISQLEIPLTQIGNAGIRVQALSNNNNCYSSVFSDVIYLTAPSNSLSAPTVNLENNILSWSAVSSANAYYVEVSNLLYAYAEITKELSLDLNEICNTGEYNIKVVAIGDNVKQAEYKDSIQYNKNLEKPKNVQIINRGNGTYLTFDEVANADGYILYLKRESDRDYSMRYRLFTTNSINITSYISEPTGYSLKVKAVKLSNTLMLDSEESDEQQIQSIHTLSEPELSIISSDGKYYLRIVVNEADKAKAEGCEVWINDKTIGVVKPYEDIDIDITTYFANGVECRFMVKAKAIDSPYIKDSNIVTYSYVLPKQLGVVEDIKVTEFKDESKYILTFKEQQTLAAKYLVEIRKENDSNFKKSFEVEHNIVDITSYLGDKGTYKVYVKAIAYEGSGYTDSPEGGNPDTIVKGETLNMVENVNITKCTGENALGEVDLTWDKVENSSGYQVYVYYNSNHGEVLKKSIFVTQSDNPSVNIGSGDYLCLNKEGSYVIKIKTIGDGKEYENSQTMSVPYVYVMENVLDFKRNTVFMNGNEYSYKVETAEDLKNLLWYHYLYNNEVWQQELYIYNLKVYFSKSLDNLALEVDESGRVADEVRAFTTNTSKMNIIARALLSQYPEISNITYGYKQGNATQSFCLNPYTNIYIFKYQDVLSNDKTDTIPTNSQLYNEKLDLVDSFDQRSPTYVFAIDRQDAVDVTTTEQLFMALQYNKKPNFVGVSDMAKAVYENAKFILRQVCSDNMTEYEKVLNIYDFLTKRVILNKNVALSDVNSQGNLKELYLEGILYNYASDNGLYSRVDEVVDISADSEGLAKTFVALCAIEGIDAIKVNGNKQVNGTAVNYAWNKVYIDIDTEDEDKTKKWYAVDLAKAIDNSISIKKEGVTNTYQIALHKYFLITDDKIDVQAKTLHKRLGGSEIDYKAETAFNYYEYQKYSFKVENYEVENLSFKATNNAGIISAIAYGMVKTNERYRVVIDIEYVPTVSISDEQIINNIETKFYNDAQQLLNYSYAACNLEVKVVDNRYIALVFEGANYGK